MLRQVINEKVQSIAQELHLELNHKVKYQLEIIDTDSFDLFLVEKETKGNELVVVSCFLMRKHQLFNDLMIDPYTFTNFMRAV